MASVGTSDKRLQKVPVASSGTDFQVRAESSGKEAACGQTGEQSLRWLQKLNAQTNGQARNEGRSPAASWEESWKKFWNPWKNKAWNLASDSLGWQVQVLFLKATVYPPTQCGK